MAGYVLRRFINEKKSFRQISWPVAGCLDRLTCEMTNTSNTVSAKQKLVYMIVRYLPFALSYAVFRLVKK